MIRVSNSKLKTWRRCPKKYDYKYMQGLRPKQKYVQLERGSWIHSLLEAHYNGEDWRLTHADLTRDFYNLFEEMREPLGDLPTECARIMTAYLRRYAKEDSRLVTVDTELDEIITLPNGLELQIIVDWIVEDTETGLLWAWDHKTRKNFAHYDDMSLDPQLSLYYYGLEQMGYTPMGGVGYNELRTKPPRVPPLLKDGTLSVAKIDTDVRTYREAIRANGLDEADYREMLLKLIRRERTDPFFRRTKLPKDPPVLKQMVKETTQTAQEIMAAEKRSRFPRTFIPNSCKWDCEFRDVCIVELHGGDAEPMKKMNFERRKRGESRKK